VRDVPKISVPVPLKYPVTRIFHEMSGAAVYQKSVLVPQAFRAHMRLPVEVSFARKISLPPELERGVPKISVFVPANVQETRIFHKESTIVV
jgi:hypothetical protein